MNTVITSQITEVESVDDECIDATVYMVGTTKNVSFQIPYADLTAPQKATVDAFRALIISLAPDA